MTTDELDVLDRDAVPEINPLYLFRWEEPQQAHVLLYPEGVVKLNETAGAILGLCDGTRSAARIAEEMAGAFQAEDVQTKVLRFLEVSHAKGWIRIKS